MHFLSEYVRLVVLASIPEFFACMSLALAIWRFKPDRPLLRVALFALIGSLVVDVDFFLVPGEVHVLTTFVLTLLLSYLFFPQLGWKNLILLFLTLYILNTIGEITAAFVTQMVYGLEDAKTMMRGSGFYRIFSVIFPIYVIYYLASLYLWRRKFSVLAVLHAYLIGIRGAPLKKMLLLAFVQAMALGVLFVLWNNKPHLHSLFVANLLLYLLVALTFTAFFYTLWLLTRLREDAVRMTQDVYVEEISKMFTSIRGQRHDFLNHVQVMHTMLQMNKIDQLRTYMADFVKEAQSVSDIVHYDSPALAAFVQSKTAVALARDIRFRCMLPPSLRLEPSVKSIDLVKMLGNLVDNAFDEVESLPAAEREVFMQIRSGDGVLELNVQNYGRVLSHQELDRLCLPGYTTKTANHTGLGLAIVLERVQYYGGKLLITSDADNGTVFRILLPHADDSTMSL